MTKEIKHAPGPWHVAPEGYIRTEFGSEGGSGLAVAWVILKREWGPATYEANANLIAAAPEMLEALRAVANVYLARELGRPDRVVVSSAALEAVHAAIAKAEGRKG